MCSPNHLKIFSALWFDVWFVVLIHYIHTPHLDLIELCVLLILIPLPYTQVRSSFVKVAYLIPKNWYQRGSESILYSEVLWCIFSNFRFESLSTPGIECPYCRIFSILFPSLLESPSMSVYYIHIFICVLKRSIGLLFFPLCSYFN